MCFIHLCRLFTTQSFDFSGSNLPGASDTLSFALSMKFLLPRSSFLSVSLYSLPTLLVLALEESDQIRHSLLQKTFLESPFTDTLSPTLVCALFLWAPTISHAFFYQNTDHVGLYAMLCYAKSLQSCPTMGDPHRRQLTRLRCPWDSPGKNTGVGCHCLC